MAYDDIDMSYADIKEMAGDGWVDPYIEFLDGEKFKIDYIDDSETGTYKVNGKSIDMTIDGDTVTATIDGKKITLEENGVNTNNPPCLLPKSHHFALERWSCSERELNCVITAIFFIPEFDMLLSEKSIAL